MHGPFINHPSITRLSYWAAMLQGEMIPVRVDVGDVGHEHDGGDDGEEGDERTPAVCPVLEAPSSAPEQLGADPRLSLAVHDSVPPHLRSLL